MEGSVLQKWVMALDWKSQTGLLSVVRGVDNMDVIRTDIFKDITKQLRGVILNNADNATKFMTLDPLLNVDTAIEEIMVTHKLSEITNMDRSDGAIVTSHWLDHIKLAVSIIRKQHPDPYVRYYWSNVNLVIQKHT